MTTYLYQQKNAIRVGFFNDRIITFSRPGHVCAWACTVAALLMYDAVSEEKCAAGYRALTDLTTSNKGMCSKVIKTQLMARAVIDRELLLF